MALEDKGLAVGAPCVASPSEDLHEELGVGLEGGSQRALRGHLHVHLPAVGNQPARHELVITRNQWVPGHFETW